MKRTEHRRQRSEDRNNKLVTRYLLLAITLLTAYCLLPTITEAQVAGKITKVEGRDAVNVVTTKDPHYFTTINHIDISGANTYRVVTTGVTKISREETPEGAKYTYTPFETAVIVAGQKEPSLFSFPPIILKVDPKTRIVTSEEPLVTGLLDFVNPYLQKEIKRRKPGDTWQVTIPIGQDTKYLPESITVTLEMEIILASDGSEFRQVTYYSDTFTFYAFDEDGGQVEAHFAGFNTIDPIKNIAVHAGWSFYAVRTMKDGTSDVFYHWTASYKSDSHGFPLIPFDIYAVKPFPLEEVEITSDPNPPQWAAQALGISNVAWIRSELNTGQNQISNPLPALILVGMGVAAIGDAVIETATDWYNGGPSGDGFSMFKSGGRAVARELGADEETGAAIGGGVRTITGLVGAGPAKLIKGAGKTAAYYTTMKKTKKCILKVTAKAAKRAKLYEKVDKVKKGVDYSVKGVEIVYRRLAHVPPPPPPPPGEDVRVEPPPPPPPPLPPLITYIGELEFRKMEDEKIRKMEKELFLSVFAIEQAFIRALHSNMWRLATRLHIKWSLAKSGLLPMPVQQVSPPPPPPPGGVLTVSASILDGGIDWFALAGSPNIGTGAVIQGSISGTFNRTIPEGGFYKLDMTGSYAWVPGRSIAPPTPATDNKIHFYYSGLAGTKPLYGTTMGGIHSVGAWGGMNEGWIEDGPKKYWYVWSGFSGNYTNPIFNNTTSPVNTSGTFTAGVTGLFWDGSRPFWEQIKKIIPTAPHGSAPNIPITATALRTFDISGSGTLTLDSALTTAVGSMPTTVSGWGREQTPGSGLWDVNISGSWSATTPITNIEGISGGISYSTTIGTSGSLDVINSRVMAIDNNTAIVSADIAGSGMIAPDTNVWGVMIGKMEGSTSGTFEGKAIGGAGAHH